MDLTTYAGLVAAVQSFLNRADLASQAPAFISMCTARLNRILLELRHPSMIERDEATAVSEYVPLPASFAAVHMLKIRDSDDKLSFVGPDEARDMVITGDTRFYTIMGGQLWLRPAPTSIQLDLWYYKRLTALSADAVNWAFERYPDAYLYGSLVHSAPFLDDDERLLLWEGAFQKIVEEIRLEAARATTPETRLAARTRSF
jgi:hypothetical protein